MGNITGSPQWEENVYQFEETDVVQGGVNGIDNIPLKQLANRTAWLRNALQGFTGITQVSASVSLTLEQVTLKLVNINANLESITCALPVLDDTQFGVRVSLVAAVNAKQVSISSSAANIAFAGSLRQSLYMGNQDTLDLLWTGSQWLVLSYNGHFLEVGKFDYGYSILPNTLVANGGLVDRADYPRLWGYAQSLGDSLVSDITWNNVAGYKGFFSTGNGASTFRLPDLRGMFIRGLDLGAGIDFGRNTPTPGGYEADDFKQHNHAFQYKKGQADQNESGTYGELMDNEATHNRTKVTTQVGGSETRPKNIGLIPLIKI